MRFRKLLTNSSLGNYPTFGNSNKQIDRYTQKNGLTVLE
jgi:hypothetical protein